MDKWEKDTIATSNLVTVRRARSYLLPYRGTNKVWNIKIFFRL